MKQQFVIECSILDPDPFKRRIAELYLSHLYFDNDVRNSWGGLFKTKRAMKKKRLVDLMWNNCRRLIRKFGKDNLDFDNGKEYQFFVATMGSQKWVDLNLVYRRREPRYADRIKVIVTYVVK